MPDERIIEGAENKPDRISDEQHAKTQSAQGIQPNHLHPTGRAAIRETDANHAGKHAQEREQHLAHKSETQARRGPSEWFMVVLTFLIFLATAINIWVFYKESED